jgi:hypothetical protein
MGSGPTLPNSKPRISLVIAIRASMATVCRLSHQRLFNAGWMGTPARQSRPRPPITTRRVSFEVALFSQPDASARDPPARCDGTRSLADASGYEKPNASRKSATSKRVSEGLPRLPRRPHPGRNADTSHERPRGRATLFQRPFGKVGPLRAGEGYALVPMLGPPLASLDPPGGGG